MASYNRIGSFLLADVLATVPSGQIHRALSTVGSAFERHYLLCTFSDELMEAGLASRLPDALKVVGLFTGARGFGANYRFETTKPAHILCDYVPGRTLAQVMEKTREEQIPLGVDHALTVLQSMAQAILLMHDKNIHHGVFSPQSVWVSYEGATQILDAPIAAIIQSLLPKAPSLKAALEPYRCTTQANAFQQDLFALGAVLYEMLTLEKLPAGPAISNALAQATLKAAQEEEAIPEEILAFLKRLLMVAQPFSTAAEFNGTLERVLYDGEYSPTTFNMAFLMHTLFREENEADGQAIKTDQAMNFASYLPAGGLGTDGPGLAKGSNRLVVGIGAAVIVSVVSLFGYLLYDSHQKQVQARKDQEMLQKLQAQLQDQLMSIQKQKAAVDQKMQDQVKQEEAQRAQEEKANREAKEARTEEARAKARQDIELAKQKALDLRKQREANRREQEALAAQQAAAQAAATRAAQAAQAAQAKNKALADKLAADRAAADRAAADRAAADKAAADKAIADKAAADKAAADKAAADKARQLAAIPPPPAVTPAPSLPSGPDALPAVAVKSNPQVPHLNPKDPPPDEVLNAAVKVSVKVFVNAAGRPMKVVILKGVDGNYGYNDSAQNAALASTYTPGSRGGKPASGWLSMDFAIPRAR